VLKRDVKLQPTCLTSLINTILRVFVEPKWIRWKHIAVIVVLKCFVQLRDTVLFNVVIGDHGWVCVVYFCWGLLFDAFVAVPSSFVTTLLQIRGNGKNVVLVMLKSCGTNCLGHVVSWWGVTRHWRSVQIIMVSLHWTSKLLVVWIVCENKDVSDVEAGEKNWLTQK